MATSIRYEDFITDIQKYAQLSESELGKIEQAFYFSAKAHSRQRRLTGEPFFIHPVAVAKRVAQWRGDADSVIAALLHDTVEDTSVRLEELRQEFGEKVAFLVDGVTNVMGVDGREERDRQSFAKLKEAVERDARVLLIRLADRSHNLETLFALPKPRQGELARETLEKLVPLAQRHGLEEQAELLREQSEQYYHMR